MVNERVEQAALVVEAGAAPRDEDAEVPTPPPWTLWCIPNASPMEPHALPLVGHRVGDAPGSLTSVVSHRVLADRRIAQPAHMLLGGHNAGSRQDGTLPDSDL